MPQDFEDVWRTGDPGRPSPDETCRGVAECTIPLSKYRPGMCPLNGCPRRIRTRAEEIRELLDVLG